MNTVQEGSLVPKPGSQVLNSVFIPAIKVRGDSQDFNAIKTGILEHLKTVQGEFFTQEKLG